LRKLRRVIQARSFKPCGLENGVCALRKLRAYIQQLPFPRRGLKPCGLENGVLPKAKLRACIHRPPLPRRGTPPPVHATPPPHGHLRWPRLHSRWSVGRGCVMIARRSDRDDRCFESGRGVCAVHEV
jgi:hypothetical protein